MNDYIMEMSVPSSANGLFIRATREEDAPLILDFIKGIAEYEKMSHEVEATEELLRESIFVKHQAEVLIAEHAGEPVGFAVFFHNFSTFVGKAGLYLEDLYVRPEMRGNGFGKALLTEIFRIAAGRNCKRVEWSCLNWNKPAIDFYHSMGAFPMSDWTVFRKLLY
jgi:GNAT superfamily N-acetyltransferase